jgi:hypothetical protein
LLVKKYYCSVGAKPVNVKKASNQRPAYCFLV